MNDIVKKDIGSQVESMIKASEFFAKGGMFVHPKEGRPLNQAEIFSIVEYGRELGIEPVIALQNIVPVKGRLCTSASIMLAMAVQAGVRYQVLREEVDVCSIKFEREGQEPYISTFDKREAEQAGLLRKDNWNNYPKDMYRARAIARGCRFVVPDKLAGLYLEEEIPEETIKGKHPDQSVPLFDHLGSASATLHIEPNSPVLTSHKPDNADMQGFAMNDTDPVTEKQVKKVNAMLGSSAEDVFAAPLKEYLYEIGLLDETKSLKHTTKKHASDIIQGLDKEKGGRIMLDLYAEKKYHDELKEAFNKASKPKRIKLLIGMAQLIEDLGTLPRKISDELTDQQTADYFALFLRAINNQEENRKSNGQKNIVTDAIKMFDASVVSKGGYTEQPREDDFSSII